MAKNRYINTHFWDDTYIQHLDPLEKLLYLYLLTNSLTDLSGAYEISLRRIAFDTGIDADMVKKLFARFEQDNKVYYKDGWILLVNFLKHQKLNPNMVTAVENSLSTCPTWICETLRKALKGFESIEHLNLILSNLNLNLISSNGGAPKSDDVVLNYYSSITKNPISDADYEARKEVADIDPVICQIGVQLSVQRATERVNSFRYCIGAIQETCTAPITDPDLYLQRLESGRR